MAKEEKKQFKCPECASGRYPKTEHLEEEWKDGKLVGFACPSCGYRHDSGE